jgi:hypothetical protein
MRKIKKKKIKNELNEVSIEKESIIKRIFNFFKTKKENGVFIKGKRLKLTDTSKVKISVKGLSNATLIPIFIKNMK